MSTPFRIVKDSSIWYSGATHAATFKLDSTLHIGTVIAVNNDAETGELLYVVEVRSRGDDIPIQCRMVRRFGGVFNYEDIVLRGYDYTRPANMAAKAGDTVLVGMLGGQGRNGVILGGLSHIARKNLKKDNGPELKSEFNGIETYINKEGEYTLTFKAQPTNLADLTKAPIDGRVPQPQYDTDIGGGYLKWDKTGSFTISDSAKEGPQSLYVDKANGTILLTSGKVSLKFDKNAESVDYKCQKYVLTSPDIKLGGSSVTEQAVFGTTYRAQEGTMNSVLFANLVTLATSLGTAGAALSAAGGDPVFSGICPGAAASVVTAGGTITSMAALATAMAQAISTFEANAATYLSNVVKVG